MGELSGGAAGRCDIDRRCFRMQRRPGLQRKLKPEPQPQPNLGLKSEPRPRLRPHPEPEPELFSASSGDEDRDDDLPSELQTALVHQSARIERLDMHPTSSLRAPSPSYSAGSSDSYSSGDESMPRPAEATFSAFDGVSRFRSCQEEGQLSCLTSCPVGVGCIVVLVTAAIIFSLAIADMRVLAGSVEGVCVLPDDRHCQCLAEESPMEPDVIFITCTQHHAAAGFKELSPYAGPGSLPSMCNFTRAMPRSWVRSAEVQLELQQAFIRCDSALLRETGSSELCWMLPAERGRIWSHCVGKGDVDGPMFAANKSEARRLVSFSSILIFLSLLFLFKCPWTRTRQRAITLRSRHARTKPKAEEEIGA